MLKELGLLKNGFLSRNLFLPFCKVANEVLKELGLLKNGFLSRNLFLPFCKKRIPSLGMIFESAHSETRVFPEKLSKENSKTK
jgi:hypothetical protein